VIELYFVKSLLEQSSLAGTDLTSLYQLIVQVGIVSGALVTIGTLVVKITRHITKVEARITNETTRIDGRINQLEERINGIRHEVYRQQREFSKLNNYVLNNAQMLVKLGEMRIELDAFYQYSGFTHSRKLA
jgi:hypothetical protein